MKTPEHWRADALMRLVRRCQPNVLIDDRLDSHERGNPQSRFPGDYYSPEQVVPASPPTLGGKRRVWESLITMNDYWGYHAGDQNFKPTRALVHILVRCVANDGNLLLNVGPDATGRIPEPCVTRLREMGVWLGRYGQTIYGAGAARGLTPPPGCEYTQSGRRLFLHVLDWPHMPIRLPGLQGKVRGATLLKDGSNVPLVTANATDKDATIVLGFHEPDPLDSVIELHLAE
jgi:alpha-L-fucosidase